MHDRNTDGSGLPDGRGSSDAHRATGSAMGSRSTRRRLLRLLLPLGIAVSLLIGAGDAAAGTGVPINTGLPLVGGTARDGSKLSAGVGKWQGLTPMTFAYQWMLCDASGNGCSDIASAQSRTYLLGHQDVGLTLRVAVTATNTEGSASATSSPSKVIAPLKPGKAKAPVISGTPQDGQLLTAGTGTWKGTPPFSFAYQWKSCVKLTCTVIPGATEPTYRPVTSEIGLALRVLVTATNVAGAATGSSASTAKVVAGPPVNTAPPAVSGLPVDGQTLTATSGTWVGTAPFTYGYQWRSCSLLSGECTDIAGATGASYTAGPLDVANALEVVVTTTSSHGTASATSAQTSVVSALLPGNTGLPSITGLLQDGGLLSAVTGSWSGTGPLAYSYQWQLCNASGEACKDIAGAIESTLALLSGEVGSTVRVIVTATNSAGSTQAASPATSLIGALLPSNTGLPSITGSLIDGQLLSAATGSWSGTAPVSYAYQWQLCNSAGEACKDIAGAIESTLSLLSGEVGSTVRVVVTATNSAGSTQATSAATSLVGALLPGNTSLPSITGSLIDGQLLNAATGGWSGTSPISYGYQWEQCNAKGEACKEISGAAGSTLGLVSGLVGSTVRVVVTATNSGGSTQATTPASGLIAALLPGNTSLPSIGGILEDGKTLAAGTGSWSGTAPISYAYQWQQCNAAGESCTNINEATGGTLGLISSLVGSTVRVVVTATNSGGSTQAASAATAPILAVLPGNTSLPSIAGSLLDGQTLTAATGAWSGTAPFSYGYRWQQCDNKGEACKEISGATGATLGLVSSLVGSTVKVIVTATNSRGSTQATSAATGLIAALLPGNTSLPSIAGLAEDGQKLTGATGSWSGTTPISYSYAWQQCNAKGEECKAISGGTGETLGLVSSLVKSTVRLVVTAKNPGGETSAASAPTSAVLAALPLNKVIPTVSGILELGKELLAHHEEWTGTAPITYTYQWQLCGVLGLVSECKDIAGATKEKFVLELLDVGLTLRVGVIAHNERGVSETVYSKVTGLIAGLKLSPRKAQRERTSSCRAPG